MLEIEIPVKNLGASLRGIEPVYPVYAETSSAQEAGLVQLTALHSLQSNFLKQSFTNKRSVS